MVMDVQHRLERNLIKAIDEHRGRSSLMTFDEYQRSLKPSSIVKIIVSENEARGKREEMEDAHCITCIGENILVGVFDGHNGVRAARFANGKFSELFSQALVTSAGSVHKAFEQVFPELHQQFIKDSRNRGGTTALGVYLDGEKQTVYTATLGDSEAFLYRKINGVYKALPLSCVRNWGSKADAGRVAKAYNLPQIELNWPENPDPQSLCIYSKQKASLNISRAIGDREFSFVNDLPLVIQKPKITEAVFQPGDFIIAACDGVWDFLRHEIVIQEIHELKPGESLAKRITLSALDNSTDNITVVALKVIEVKN